MDLPDAHTVKTAMDAVKNGLDLFRTAIGLAKDSKELLSDPGKQAAFTKGLDEADKASRLAEVQIAQALGYHLCQCTFPPQVMLSSGRSEKGRELFMCSRCGKQEPSPQEIFSAERPLYAGSAGKRADFSDFT